MIIEIVILSICCLLAYRVGHFIGIACYKSKELTELLSRIDLTVGRKSFYQIYGYIPLAEFLHNELWYDKFNNDKWGYFNYKEHITYSIPLKSQNNVIQGITELLRGIISWNCKL
jgi:hypothetical protein